VSDKITIFKNHSPRRAIAGKDKLVALGYEDATIIDAQLVFDAMLYVPGVKAYEGWVEEQADFETRLLGLIADIRIKSGVGQKPMLIELADAISAELARLTRERDEAFNAGVEAAANVSIGSVARLPRITNTHKIAEICQFDPLQGWITKEDVIRYGSEITDGIRALKKPSTDEAAGKSGE
jgi:hypothetical protein